MTKRKRTNHDLQNTIQKTEDRATRTSLKSVCALMCSGWVSSCCATCDTRGVTTVTRKDLTWKSCWTQVY